MVQTTSTATLLTYQPAVTSTKIGTTVPFDVNQFNYLDPNGFEVTFELSRNTFTIQRYRTSSVIPDMFGHLIAMIQYFLGFWEKHGMNSSMIILFALWLFFPKQLGLVSVSVQPAGSHRVHDWNVGCRLRHVDGVSRGPAEFAISTWRAVGKR
jgi:hypothetical protein